MDRWALPGPATFIDSALEAIRDGANVVIGTPSCAADALSHVLEDRLAEEGWPLTGPLTPTERPPIDELYAALEIDDNRPSGRTVASLITRAESRRLVLVKGVGSQHWPAWSHFLDEYANASRAVDKFDRTQVVVLTSGVPAVRLPAKAPALQSLAWDGHVGEADVFSYVLQVWRRNGQRIDAHAKLIARIVVRLALWDFDLIDRLLATHWRDLFDPMKALREADDGRDTWATLGPTWETGGLAEFDGERSQHALLLLRTGDQKSELSMRLWAAHAAEILPILELKRRQLALRMKSCRALPSSLRLNDEIVRDLDDVEIGGLVHLARVHRLPPDIVRTAERYRHMRNKLAHLEPVDADEALELLSGQVAR